MAGMERRGRRRRFRGRRTSQSCDAGEKKDAQVLGLGAGKRQRAQDPGEDRRDV